MSRARPPCRMSAPDCKRCGEPVTEYCWRDPTRCLECYLDMKRGAVIVCTEGDVRMLDNVRGGYATRKSAPRVLTRKKPP